MKEEIESFKRKNGNVIYTQKELIQALHEKIDKIYDRIDDKLDEKVDKSTFRWVLTGLSTLFLAIVGFIFRLIKGG